MDYSTVVHPGRDRKTVEAITSTWTHVPESHKGRIKAITEEQDQAGRTRNTSAPVYFHPCFLFAIARAAITASTRRDEKDPGLPEGRLLQRGTPKFLRISERSIDGELGVCSG